MEPAAKRNLVKLISRKVAMKALGGKKTKKTKLLVSEKNAAKPLGLIQS